MIVKCTLAISMRNIKAYSRKISELPPLPAFIIKREQVIHDSERGDDRIVIIFEFDKSTLAEAWEIIFNHLDAFHDIPGFAFSAHRSLVFS